MSKHKSKDTENEKQQDNQKCFDIDIALAYCVATELAKHDQTGSNLSEQELNEIKRKAKETAKKIKEDYEKGLFDSLLSITKHYTNR